MADILEQLTAARDAARQGDFAEARGTASEILASNPHCLLALRLQGWAELELGLEEALATFRACAAIDPLDPLAEVGMALVEEDRAQLAEALRHFVRAYELDAADQRIRVEIRRLGAELPETRLADGLSLLCEGSYERAIEALRAAAAAAPDDPAARLGLARALWSVGAREQVTNLCTSILATLPNCLEALIYLVAAELAQGRTLRTRELLARLDAVDPGHVFSERLLEETGVSRAVQGGLRRPGMTASFGLPRS